MSPQDKVERVLKEIHVTFSKSQTYDGQPDKIIIDRKQFLNLLDRLNNGIYDMMEQYEQTRQSRMNAERAFRKKGDEIIEQANASADDIYAASFIYTADAIGKIRELMDETNDSMNDLFRQFRKELRDQKDLLKSHETELQAQLADLADTKKYLSVIQDINRERAKQDSGRQREKETGRTMVHTPASAADVKVNEAYFEKTGKTAPATETESSAIASDKPDIMIHKDAPYFKWKAEQEKKEGIVEGDADIPGRENVPEPENEPENAAIESSNPEFPDEEAIRQAVLADELAWEAEQEEQRNRELPSAGHILKTIIFGKE